MWLKFLLTSSPTSKLNDKKFHTVEFAHLSLAFYENANISRFSCLTIINVFAFRSFRWVEFGEFNINSVLIVMYLFDTCGFEVCETIFLLMILTAVLKLFNIQSAALSFSGTHSKSLHRCRSAIHQRSMLRNPSLLCPNQRYRHPHASSRDQSGRNWTKDGIPDS